jgi:hypothetical protein
MKILRKSMPLKSNKLINSQRPGREGKWHIENEGISRDVAENKWKKSVREPVPRDVVANNRLIARTP